MLQAAFQGIPVAIQSIPFFVTNALHTLLLPWAVGTSYSLACHAKYPRVQFGFHRACCSTESGCVLDMGDVGSLPVLAAVRTIH